MKTEQIRRDKMTDAWECIIKHFDGQKPGKDELKEYMKEINNELMIDVDIDDEFVDSILKQF